jgi:hypothetical protein
MQFPVEKGEKTVCFTFIIFKFCRIGLHDYVYITIITRQDGNLPARLKYSIICSIQKKICLEEVITNSDPHSGTISTKQDFVEFYKVSMSRSSIQCGILNISQPYRPPRPVTRIALLYGDGVCFL